jgi:hypothetical protein
VKKSQKVELMPWTAGGFLLMGVSLVAGLALFATTPEASKQAGSVATSTDFQTQTLGEVTEKKTIMLFGEDVAFKKKVVKDPNVTKEQSYVQTQGVKGKRDVTYEVTYTNGKETQRVVIDQKVLVKPVDEVTIKGTKVASAAAPKPQVQAVQTETKPKKEPKEPAPATKKEVKKVKYRNKFYCVAKGEMFYDSAPNVVVVGMYTTKDECLASSNL